MKIHSLIRENDRLVPVEVELSFVPGLPNIQFLGLPDQGIRESIHRIKSAIRAQGFDFPKAQQVLVNLRPSHLKKSSRGLELAVAVGLLWETNQVKKPTEASALVYGELALNGEVYEPDDLITDFDGEDVTVWTGVTKNAKSPFARSCVKELKDLSEPEVIPAQAREYKIERPSFGLDLQFPVRQGRILELVALGEHSLLLAGPSGSGKSTFAKTLSSLLLAPSQEDMHEIHQSNKGSSEKLNWRPLVHPHHSTSPLGLIGGGVPVSRGEISRAHKGVLILDELLEFHPRAQEALREPMEEFRIRLRRGRFVDEHPAETLVIATTNLCPCGDWVPNARVICGRSIRKCQSYMERLSGPLVDRFQMTFFTQKSESGERVSGEEILRKLEKVRAFRKEISHRDSRFLKLAGRWTWEELIRDLPEFYMRELFPKEMISRRRDLSTLRVARSIADLNQSEKLLPAHVEEALKFTYIPFESLKRLGC
ncbi:ATP-binding protein [Bdellovibrio sp. 22V]|uniref:ATP-binding protein n=1 Tax=Bdellovibrio TaxID=958 RepID=UPI002542E519|nr:ATP-binding protein [Bdellovibrio sp. 22V]WII71639.1 ATP-binding protein [Bdellovibrio sp. 22V]